MQTKRPLHRLRFFGGTVTKEQLSFLNEALKENFVEELHFTSGQSLQVFPIPAQADRLFSLAEHYALSDEKERGWMMTADPLHGLRKEAPFDIAASLALFRESYRALPEALPKPNRAKIAFSAEKNLTAQTAFKDLALLAREDDTFTVFSGGSLGANPQIAVPVLEQIPQNAMACVIAAYINVLRENCDKDGLRKTRAGAIHKKLGSAFAPLFEKHYRAIYAREKSTLPTICGKSPQPNESRPHIVKYHPFCGRPSLSVMKNLLSFRNETETAIVRVGADESLYIANLTEDETARLHAILAEDSPKNAFEDSVSCAGKEACGRGVCDSIGAIKEIRTALAGKNTDYLPTIRISGCVSSCSAASFAEIGLIGLPKRADGAAVDAFRLVIGGGSDERGVHLAEPVAHLAKSALPRFFTALNEKLIGTKMPFTPWQKQHAEEFRALCKEFEGQA